MRTTIELPDAVFRQAKRVAAEKGSTLRELVTAAVVHELQGRRAAPARTRLPLPAVRVPPEASILRLGPQDLARADAEADVRRAHEIRRRR